MAVRITGEEWVRMVEEKTGCTYPRKPGGNPIIRDKTYILKPESETIPKWFLKSVPYVRGSDDCDDVTHYGYTEIHEKNKQASITLVSGRVDGFGNHDFLLVGIEENGLPVAAYYHKLTKKIYRINDVDVTQTWAVW